MKPEMHRLRDLRVASLIVATDGSGDYLDIQSAINALPATGGIVYIKEGTYTITTAIDINKDNVSLIGSGFSTVIDVNAAISGITSTAHDNFVIANINIDGTNQGALSNLMYFTNCISCRVEGCWIHDATRYGLVFILSAGTSEQHIITNNYIYSNGDDGMRLTRTSKSIVTSNLIYSNGDNGIDVETGGGVGSNRNIIHDNLIFSNTGSGIDMSGAVNATLNSFMGNTIIDNGRGIWLTGTNHLVKSNIFNNNTLGNINDGSTGSLVFDNLLT